MTISNEAIEAAARVAEFVRQYRIRNDASPDGVIYNVWMDAAAKPAELRLDDLEALTAAAPAIQAAALRDAAGHLMVNMTEPSGEAYHILHERANSIEGKES